MVKIVCSKCMFSDHSIFCAQFTDTYIFLAFFGDKNQLLLSCTRANNKNVDPVCYFSKFLPFFFFHEGFLKLISTGGRLIN